MPAHRARAHPPGEVDGRLEGLGWNVVVRFAVRERERPEPVGVTGREDLRHRAARVVGNEVDFVESERVAEREQPVGQRPQ